MRGKRKRKARRKRMNKLGKSKPGKALDMTEEIERELEQQKNDAKYTDPYEIGPDAARP